MKLEPNEKKLSGGWHIIESSIVADEVSKRIEKLTLQYLVKIAIDESGWNQLFQDPKDKRYWELSYPESEFHGGGYPHLTNLSEHEVKEKYHFPFPKGLPLQ